MIQAENQLKIKLSKRVILTGTVAIYLEYVLVQEAAQGLTDDPQPTMDPAPKRSKQEAILECLLGKEENTQS